MSFEEVKKVTQVDSRKQLVSNRNTRFEDVENSGIRVLFVGNSVTLHERLEEIGWFGDWGMAASSKEKDYVHLIEKYIKEKDENAAFCICNAAEWEHEYNKPNLDIFIPAREFEADIIIVKLSANTPLDLYEKDLYKQRFSEFINFLNKTGKAKIIIATEFCKHPAEEVLNEYSEENNLPLCYLSDIHAKDEFKAGVAFWHNRVANHPADYGMKIIAERIISLLEF